MLNEVLSLLNWKKLLATPIGKLTGSWQTISEEQKDLNIIEGKNMYQARRGAATDPYGVFWLEVRQCLSDGNIIIRNLNEYGKRKIQSVEETIESDLVFPMVREKDIYRWIAIIKIYLLMVQDPVNRQPHPKVRLQC